MAVLVVDGGDLVVEMRRSEKFWSLQREVRVPLSAVRSVRILANPWTSLRGWRVTGVAIPGYVAMGKRRHGSGYDFSMLRRDQQALAVDLNGTRFCELLVGVPDAAATGAAVASAAGIRFDPAPRATR